MNTKENNQRQRDSRRSRDRSRSPINRRDRSNSPYRNNYQRNHSGRGGGFYHDRKGSSRDYQPRSGHSNYDREKGRERNRIHRSFSRSRSRSASKSPINNHQKLVHGSSAEQTSTAKQLIRKELQGSENKSLNTNSQKSFSHNNNGNGSTTNPLLPLVSGNRAAAQDGEKVLTFGEGTKDLKEEEEDAEIELDFEDFEELTEKKRKEDEELKRAAEERRRRAEEIKLKYQQQRNQAVEVESVEQNVTGAQPTVHHEAEDDAAVLTDSILSKNAAFPISFEEERQANATIMEITAEDEGNQLAREKLALEEENDALGKVAFDMFSESPSDLEKNNGKLPIFPTAHPGVNGFGGKRATREALLDGENPHLQSNWDDHDGYYKATIGELIGDRFQILGIVGKGVFSTVLKCMDTRVGDGTNIVAIKMIRNNDIMRKAAEKEKNILLSIAEKDPNNKRFCVKLITYLEYRQHVALVFEYQSMNLREALKKFGKDVGINITAVRIYARQLFVALRYLMELKVIHADIKLDNILLSEDLKQVRLCDFGSAFRETDTDNDPTPYLVNRFSRAPEIILGLGYDRQIDLWSICVSLFELFTGHVMFPGRSNNEMLRLMMTLKGRFPNKMIKNHFRAFELLQIEPHFEQDYRFRSHEVDSVTGKPVLRILDITNPTRDLAQIMRSSRAGADDIKLVNQFIDLLDKGINLDPSKRLTVSDALRHPFIVKS